jgi:chromosome segregation ATPase
MINKVSENAKLKEELRQQQQKFKQELDQQLQMARKAPLLDQEKQNMANTLLSKQQEIARLSDELNFFTTQNLEFKEQIRNEKSRVMELEGIELHNNSIVASLQHEILQANKSIEWLNEELSRKSNQLADYRREKSDQFLKLQNQLEAAMQEKSALEVRDQLTQKRLEELEAKLSQKLESIREIENDKLLLEQQFKSEMVSQKKLAELYQNKSQEVVKQNQELELLIRELEARILKITADHERMVGEYDDTISSLKEHSSAQELEIEKLRSEMKTMNVDAINQSSAEAIGELSETAAAASKLQKAGKSITQVYAEYAKIQKELIKEKSEVARLQECLNHIVAEFEQRVFLANERLL